MPTETSTERRPRLFFASPTYGPVDPVAIKSQRVAICAAMGNGVDVVGDISPDRMTYDAARNYVVDLALKNADAARADGIFWCDSDIVLPSHAIERMGKHLLSRDFVSGIYFQREPPHYPLIARYDRSGDVFNWAVEWPTGQELQKLDGCGFGCVVTSMKMLKVINANFPECFKYGKRSEDLEFCLRAKYMHYQLFIDPAIVCGHIGSPKIVTHATFQDSYTGMKMVKAGA